MVAFLPTMVRSHLRFRSLAVLACTRPQISALREWMAQLGLRETVKVGNAGKWKTATQVSSPEYRNDMLITPAGQREVERPTYG